MVGGFAGKAREDYEVQFLLSPIRYPLIFHLMHSSDVSEILMGGSPSTGLNSCSKPRIEFVDHALYQTIDKGSSLG